MRQLTVPFTCTFLHSVNYSSAGSGEVRVLLDTAEPLEQRHVILFEGVVVSGITLKYLTDWLRLRRPASLKCCALVVKRTSLTVDVDIDYVDSNAPGTTTQGRVLPAETLHRSGPPPCLR